QGHVFGHVVILVTNPFGNSKLPARGTLNHHSNTRWPRVSQGAAIYVGYESRHQAYPFAGTMRQRSLRVKRFVWFQRISQMLWKCCAKSARCSCNTKVDNQLA